MAIDIPGFIADFKEHATDHGFHVHDERHFVETYSLRQSWEVDVHPESGCGGPIDLHVALDVNPNVLLSLREKLEAMSDFAEPENEYHLDLYFNWAVPPLLRPPDLLVLATDLAGIGGLTLPVEVSAVDSFADALGESERRLQVTGKTQMSLVDVLMGREQLCDVLDLAREVSEYMVGRAEEWMGQPEV